MDKFQNKYRIPSNRKPNWDYSTDGTYFLTIITQNRECNLGTIVVETHGRASHNISPVASNESTVTPNESNGLYNNESNDLINNDSPVTPNESTHATMKLSDFGNIVELEWYKSFDIRDELYLDEFVIMPNHIHAIVVLNNQNDGGGIDGHDCPHDRTHVETHGRASLQQPSTSPLQQPSPLQSEFPSPL